jgi:hypothetical protein
MIYTDELAASLDQIDQVVVFHRVEQTEVQRLAQQLAERAVLMVEQNEKTLDVKLGQAPGNDRTTNRDGQAGGRIWRTTGEERRSAWLIPWPRKPRTYRVQQRSWIATSGCLGGRIGVA